MVNFNPNNNDERKRLEDLRRRRGFISGASLPEAPAYTPPKVDPDSLDAYFAEQFDPNRKRAEEAKVNLREEEENKRLLLEALENDPETAGMNFENEGINPDITQIRGLVGASRYEGLTPDPTASETEYERYERYRQARLNIQTTGATSEEYGFDDRGGRMGVGGFSLH